MAAVQILELRPADTIPPGLAEAITPEFLAICRIPPVPIRLRPELAPGVPAECFHLNATDRGEVHILLELVEGAQPDISDIRRLYLHEISHRLSPPSSDHDAPFATLYLTLLRRADLLDWFDPDYDIQDEPGGLGWAEKLAAGLAQGPLSAIDCADRIAERYEAALADIEEARQTAEDQARWQLVITACWIAVGSIFIIFLTLPSGG